MSFAAIQSEFAGDFPTSTALQAEENPLSLYMRLSEEKGGLIPQAMMADILDVSSARVAQLIGAHRFEVHRIGKMNFITGDSLKAYNDAEKLAGRGHKAPTLRTCIHSALKLTKPLAEEIAAYRKKD